MNEKMPKLANQLRDFSSLFSRSEVCRWLKDDFGSIDIKLSRYNLFDENRGNSYLKVLKNIYKIIEKQYPNEYVVKNELLNQWLKKELGTNKSVVYSELRVGKAVADIAMFNGSSKVFEIKTIYDSDNRLLNQLIEYKKIFNEVYIVVPKTQYSKYVNYDKSIGVITYEHCSKKFSLEKESERHDVINANVIMEILHTKEYLEICNDYYNNLPEMNAFNQFNICKTLISKIPYDELNYSFLQTMKRRRINNFTLNNKNTEFNQICLSLNLKQTERDFLISKLHLNTI